MKPTSDRRPSHWLSPSLIILLFVALSSLKLFQQHIPHGQRKDIGDVASSITTQIPRPPPPPLVVVVAGGQRSGSTSMFNAVRMLMTIRDPNFVSGSCNGLGSLQRFSNGSAPLLKELRGYGSVLIKCHWLPVFLSFARAQNTSTRHARLDEEGVNVVLLPYRDLRDQVRSHADFHMAGMNESSGEASWVHVAQQSIRLNQEWETAVMNNSRGIDVSREIENFGETRPLKHDDLVLVKTKYEDWVGRGKSQFHFVKYLSRVLGRGFAFSDDEIAIATDMLTRIHPSTCDNITYCKTSPWHFTNMLERKHVSKSVGNYFEAKNRGKAAIARDAESRAWLFAHGYSVSE